MIKDVALTINIAEYGMARNFTVKLDDNGDVSEINLTEDEARRVWEAFAPYFDGREVSEG